MTAGPSKSIVRVGSAAMLLVAALGVAGESLGIRLNLSASLPAGLYKRTPAGELVEFCQPGASRYVRPGRCRDGSAPLLKPVVATAGQTVVFGPEGISVDGLAIPNTAPQERDRDGRALRHYPFGVYQVTTGELWVASSHHPGSYDSRYFGPIGEAEVRERLRPFLTSGAR